MVAPLTAEVDDLFLPPQALISQLKSRATELQMLPSIAIEAMQLAKKPDCSISSYSSVVERDVKLMTDMLKLANSAMYCPTTPIVSLHQAVLRLGLVECQNLILTASATSMMKRISLGQKVIREVLARHGFTTALLALQLNHTFRFGFLGEEFTAGLIHDFGRTLLAIAEPDLFIKIDPLEFDETPDLLSQERVLIGTDHCRFGAYYAIHQQLPESLQEVILFHHQPELSRGNQKLTALVAVADHMANHLQRYDGCENYDPSSNPFLPTLAKYADSRFPQKFIEMAGAVMTRAHNDAEGMSKS
ncbi:HDOD domain-containing protein [Schlesneria paludicola]|uniref:HDOD domain-containing protein n=1 Tax=Schlesneria paludicola TaxID=360056 RepID=UPI000299D22D|nr:HDOD domain-containing protein [Schlesneria paludicola]